MNIPGTVGGAVKMNANAYGGDLSRVLEWVDVAGADRRLSGANPTELGFSYRGSNLGDARGGRARVLPSLAVGRPRR